MWYSHIVSWSNPFPVLLVSRSLLDSSKSRPVVLRVDKREEDGLLVVGLGPPEDKGGLGDAHAPDGIGDLVPQLGRAAIALREVEQVAAGGGRGHRGAEKGGKKRDREIRV